MSPHFELNSKSSCRDLPLLSKACTVPLLMRISIELHMARLQSFGCDTNAEIICRKLSR